MLIKSHKYPKKQHQKHTLSAQIQRSRNGNSPIHEKPQQTMEKKRIQSLIPDEKKPENSKIWWESEAFMEGENRTETAPGATRLAIETVVQVQECVHEHDAEAGQHLAYNQQRELVRREENP